MLKFLNDHKTKIIGLSVVLISYFQLPANQAAIAALVSPAAMALIGMLLGAAAVVCGFLNAPDDKPSVPPGVSAVLAILACGLLLTLTGCAQLKSFTQTAEQNPVVTQTVFQQATMRIIEVGKTDAERKDRAAKVAAVATQVKALVGTDVVSTDTLQAALMTQINKLDIKNPSDKALAASLVSLGIAELQKHIDSGEVQKDQLVVVSKLLDYVISATAWYQ
jgi:hypothetical protein